MEDNLKKFGTSPVFFTAISTILGAVLFLRFGFAVGTLGFFGVVMLIVLGHMVTIPTALAISEIATNKRVEGGGEYFIISRSFGLNIGATIGIALYLSQSISVAFYVIAFTETFEFLFVWIRDNYGILLPRQVISVPVMLLLSALILKKGANLGVKALYFVVALLGLSIILFFLGGSGHGTSTDFNLLNAEFRNGNQFFFVFAIIFPAFTGMSAGVGLSGDLKNPSKSIPIGTVSATFIGMVLYFFIAYKLAASASMEDLLGNQLIMAKIALWGVIFVPLGLAASTISSALGSVMVAPRTLQALASDKSFPIMRANSWLSRMRQTDDEPFNASFVTCAIAIVFVTLGDVDVVAQIISMFFMITYGSLCLISFLNHFGSSPSYRPSFKSKWYISLVGFLTAVWVMFKINPTYSILALGFMTVLYLYVSSYHKDRKGLSSIFANSIFQINRNMQLYLQNNKITKTSGDWRPSAICISTDSFDRDNAFKLVDWISYKYGFGTYLHRINGYFSKATEEESQELRNKLIHRYGGHSHVYIDTLISPSYTSAISQAIQLPGISGMENNMVILEFDKEKPTGLVDIVDNYKLVNSGGFDFCVMASSRRPIQHKNGIHVWIKSLDEENANLMIILSFIIMGHPDWKKADIKIFMMCKQDDYETVKQQMNDLLEKGRLPITAQNIKILVHDKETSYKNIINENSSEAGLTIIGFRGEGLKHSGNTLFEGFDKLGNTLFVNAFENLHME